ncbi:GNAT family N-acetyltransferase [Reinekea blandensis]|uniref:Putative acetyltransferase (GNAT) family protein n=1 Tax=Reinekea blandensis MED297 TaxID=314283 RepID=A4BA24_9GAMM|nr:GNAT family N-acetyltransferase [Reinekea blandensis]EAR10780.1 putative acetyltransferase (GNAT) family protein [Reinekea sp. MED297] [Reinekea blandensis MED297]
MIKLRTEVPTVDTYIKVRLAAGLSRKSEEAARLALPNSLFAVTVYDDDKPIGIGRVIGDGGCFFEITDMAVLPDYQGQGIGRQIMTALVDWLKTNAPSTAYVSLMADHGTPDFYERFGFTKASLPKSSGMYLRIP